MHNVSRFSRVANACPLSKDLGFFIPTYICWLLFCEISFNLGLFDRLEFSSCLHVNYIANGNCDKIFLWKNIFTSEVFGGKLFDSIIGCSRLAEVSG